MSYESVVVLVIVFSIPAGLFAITHFIRVRQQKKYHQTELDLFLSNQKHDGSGISI